MKQSNKRNSFHKVNLAVTNIEYLSDKFRIWIIYFFFITILIIPWQQNFEIFYHDRNDSTDHTSSLSRTKAARRSVDEATLIGTLLIPIPARCAHKICLRSLEKRSYRAENVEGITATRKGGKDARRGGQRGETNGEKQRWDRKCASGCGRRRAKAR